MTGAVTVNDSYPQKKPKERNNNTKSIWLMVKTYFQFHNVLIIELVILSFVLTNVSYFSMYLECRYK